MVVLRLQRLGKKKEPHFRLIAQEESKNPQDKALEILGWLNPRTKERKIKRDRLTYWLSVGAQATATVHNLLVSEGIIKGPKVKAIKISKKRQEKMKINKREKGVKEEKPAFQKVPNL